MTQCEKQKALEEQQHTFDKRGYCEPTNALVDAKREADLCFCVYCLDVGKKVKHPEKRAWVY